MIEKAKLILSKINEWIKGTPPLKERLIVYAIAGIILIVFVFILPAARPSSESDGLVTDNISLNLQTDYAYLQSSYETLAFDYDKIRNTLISTITKLETSDQLAIAYKDAYDKLLVSYQAMSVAKQLLEAGNEGLSQNTDVSKEFSQQYEALVILHKEKSEQHEDLLYKIDKVSDKLFFVLTDNFSQADMDSFYIGWDKWIESLEDEE